MKMNKLVLCCLIMLFKITFINSQVVSRQLGNEEVIDSFLPFHKIGNPILHLQPKLDVENVLKEDIQSGRYLDRFAIPYETNYQVKDGKWYYYDNKLIWKIGFNAPHAASLQFMFEHLKLPKDSEMFVYSTASKVIQGPITMESITNGIFTTDVIERTGLVFIAVVFSNGSDNFNLKITKVSQGIKKIETRGWGDAKNCNFDINCSIGSPWAFQRDAVGQTVVGMSGTCSGTLINTSCQDFKPYFLTAEHCTSGSDQNPANMVFRFNYQSPTPACPGKTAGTEPPASTWITRNGATIIYSNWANKVSLLLLNGGRIGINPNESNLKMAGWDRISTPPTSGAVIHHPKYDAKKISIPSSMVTNGPNNTGLMFQVHFSQGIIEGGSSGGPLFNQHKRIVGVAEGFPAGSPEHNCSNNSTVFALFTRFSSNSG